MRFAAERGSKKEEEWRKLLLSGQHFRPLGAEVLETICQIWARGLFLLSLAIRLTHIDAAQDPLGQPSELPKVGLPFAIQQSESPVDGTGTIIEQHNGA